MMGKKERAFAALPPVALENLVPPDHFYRHLERSLDLGFGRDLVRDAYAAVRPTRDRPGRVLQAPAHPVLRGTPLRAPTHACRCRSAQPTLVSRLRPDRAAPRPLQSDPHPRAVWTRRLPPLLRDDRRAVRQRRGWSGARSSTSTPRRSRPMPRWTRSNRASPSRRISPSSSPQRKTMALGRAVVRLEKAVTNLCGCRLR